MVKIALIFAGLLLGFPAQAHDQWANGTPIPEWVKHHCCNSNEAHDLTVEMHVRAADVKAREGGEVTIKEGGEPTLRYIYYRIPGFANEVMSTNVYPSQDGDVWAFYSNAGPPQATVWCLFLPCATNDAMPKELNASCS